jgi:hypothetical protein
MAVDRKARIVVEVTVSTEAAELPALVAERVYRWATSKLQSRNIRVEQVSVDLKSQE